MISENTLARLVQDLRYAGTSPVLQYDILDSSSLLREVQQHPGFEFVHQWQLARVLKYLEMRRVGYTTINHWPLNLWTCLPYQPFQAFVDVVRKRIETNATQLHMELHVHNAVPAEWTPKPLLLKFELDVLYLRIRPQGLRWPRPKEIARKLDCGVFQVNRALQTILRKLRVPSFKNMPAVRKAMFEAGLSRDPADY